ncbi:hypothetical protein [Nocardia cyriacigeorgica]|uniref:hypothetical protein n=1 Tax=Nocardia cyriacigeorgica TaxID=135487 RepID=UPI00189449E5|nr:hypothetical protein [Nocardia cyriacigeorgica]MBF6411611.1 hypothetical protein [Nocardia cyriacigeorgica]
MDPDILHIRLDKEGLSLSIEMILPSNPSWDQEDIQNALLPHIHAAGMRMITSEVFPNNSPTPVCEVMVDPPGSMTIREMAYITATLRDLLMNEPDSATPSTLFQAVQFGELQSLLGAAETGTLDAKKDHYSRRDDRKRIELACDAAAFANSGQGGIIIIGARTVRDSHGRDVIAEVGGCPIDKGAEDRYRSALQDLIYPDLEGVEMCRSASPLGELFAILIPAQNSDRIPFFVRGGTLGEKRASTAMFQVPVRRGASNPSSVRLNEIHNRLRYLGDEWSS